MKKSILSLTKTFLILLISGCILGSCTVKKSTSIDEKPKIRIKLKEHTSIEGYDYFILKVDSVEFLTNGRGGFIRLSK